MYPVCTNSPLPLGEGYGAAVTLPESYIGAAAGDLSPPLPQGEGDWGRSVAPPTGKARP